jgi:transcriptional regulator
MYLRPAFAETDLDRIESLVRNFHFGLLVTHGPNGMDASHIPFAVEREGDVLTVTGHLAAANAQCALFDGGQALAVFSGPHAYIAPSWYVTQPSVPTWDFCAVHLHGVLEPMVSHDEMLDQLAQSDPGGFDHRQLTDKYRTMMLNGIRSFRLRAQRIEAQWKMSQNRSVADREGVIAALRAQGQGDVSDMVAATLPER